MASVEERLKLKRGQVDPWSTREKLCLASSVVRSGNQNWMSVSRSLKVFGGEPGRPADWFSQKSCAVQYDNLLTHIETPKRKKRGADGSKSEGPDLTPAEVIVKQLTSERIEELRKFMAEAKSIYMKEKEEIYLVQNGQADDRLEEMQLSIVEEKKQKELDQERHQQWLRQREERKQEIEMAWRPHAAQQHFRGPGSQSSRRPSNQSELSSEADNVESPSSSEQPTASDEVAETKPASTPTSPLLTSLLKSPSPVTGTQSSSILHSAITAQRGASPTITSLLNSSPGIPSTTANIPLSPNLKSLVSNALGGHDEVPKPQSHSTSSSPTLSMLLELPPSTPGKLPELPYSATKQAQTASTSTPPTVPKTGEELEEPIVENLLEVEAHKSPEPYHPPVALERGVEVSAAQSEDRIQDALENNPAIELTSSDLPLEVTSIETPLQGDLIIETPAAQDNQTPDNIVTADSEASPGKDLDTLKKDALPDIENVGVVLPVETETREEVETKGSVDTQDFEYVVDPADPSIDVVLQELVPEGLVDEMAVYIAVSSEDVENSVSNMLEAAESGEANPSVQVESKSEREQNNLSESISETEQIKDESEPALVTPSTHQSPLRTSTTTSSVPVSTSPRSVGRPAKGSMVARKIKMEDEEQPKSEIVPDVEDGQQLERNSETLSREALETASILIVQDNGEVVKLSESGQRTELMHDIQVIQDSSNNSVVLVPHGDVNKSKERDDDQPVQSTAEDSLASGALMEKDTCHTPKKDGQPIEINSPVRTPLKTYEKKDVISDAAKSDKADLAVSPVKIADLPHSQVIEMEPSQSKEEDLMEPNSENEESKIVEDLAEDENTEDVEPLSSQKREELLSPSKREEPSSPKKREEPLSPKNRQEPSSPKKREEPVSPREKEELLPRKSKSLSLQKRDKSPAVSDSSNELASEEDSTKEEATEELPKDVCQQEEKEIIKEKVEPTQKHVVDDKAQLAEADVPLLPIKEEKTIRADTPSTEDDNTRDTEQPQTLRGRRGRYGRDSAARSDSVPNSPNPTNISVDDEKERRLWKKSIMLVHQRISAHKNASIFQKPITDEKVQGYSSIVKRPLDLQTIKKKFESGEIRTTDEFQRDILTMFYNALMYNISNSIIYKQTQEMQEECAKHLEEYVNTQNIVHGGSAGAAHVPSRRGTRTAEKKDQDSEGSLTRRGLSEKSGLLGKRKRSFPDERSTPKRRRDDD